MTSGLGGPVRQVGYEAGASLASSTGVGLRAQLVAVTQQTLTFDQALVLSLLALLAIGGAVVAAVPVDPAIALPIKLPEPWPVIAGLGFWVSLTIAVSAISAALPAGGWISLSTLPIVAAATLGGPTSVLIVAFFGSIELREFSLPRRHMLWNHVGTALPAVAAAALVEPIRPHAGAASDVFLLLGLATSIVIGLGYLAGSGWFSIWGPARVFGYDIHESLRRNGRSQLVLASLLPLAWLAAQSYVTLGWWTPLLFGAVLGAWRLAAQHEAVHRAANEDGLTGLLNRRAFDARTARVIERDSAAGRLTGCLYLDLDGFKQVNDAFGHDAGDRLLQQVGARIQETVRPGDAVARLGGDEFAVILPGLTSSEAAHAVAARIGAALSGPWDEDELGDRVSVAASIGVAVTDPAAALDGPRLLRSADADMYATKRARRGDSPVSSE